MGSGFKLGSIVSLCVKISDCFCSFHLFERERECVCVCVSERETDRQIRSLREREHFHLNLPMSVLAGVQDYTHFIDLI